jgi:hypothetical protein
MLWSASEFRGPGVGVAGTLKKAKIKAKEKDLD